MKLPNPIRWWRNLPQKTRIGYIAGVLLALLGMEAIFLAPWAFEIAFLIDLFGAGFFDVFVIGYLLLGYSQAKAFVKTLWSFFSKVVRAILPNGRLSIAWDWDRAVLLYCEVERRTNRILVWSATVGSCAVLVVMLIRKIA